MTNGSEDGNGLQYEFLKKCQFFKVSSLARKSLKFDLTVLSIGGISTHLSVRAPYLLVDILDWQVQADDLAVNKQLTQSKEQNVVSVTLIK